MQMCGYWLGHVLRHESLLHEERMRGRLHEVGKECTWWATWWRESMWQSKGQL